MCMSSSRSEPRLARLHKAETKNRKSLPSWLAQGKVGTMSIFPNGENYQTEAHITVVIRAVKGPHSKFYKVSAPREAVWVYAAAYRIILSIVAKSAADTNGWQIHGRCQ
jgi:hypothetical protein